MGYTTADMARWSSPELLAPSYPSPTSRIGKSETVILTGLRRSTLSGRRPFRRRSLIPTVLLNRSFANVPISYRGVSVYQQEIHMFKYDDVLGKTYKVHAHRSRWDLNTDFWGFFFLFDSGCLYFEQQIRKCCLNAYALFSSVRGFWKHVRYCWYHLSITVDVFVSSGESLKHTAASGTMLKSDMTLGVLAQVTSRFARVTFPVLRLGFQCSSVSMAHSSAVLASALLLPLDLWFKSDRSLPARICRGKQELFRSFSPWHLRSLWCLDLQQDNW